MSPPLLPSVVEDDEQHLTLGDAALQAELPGVAAGVAHQAGDLDVMHGENHRGGAAGAAEHRANVGDVGRARSLAAEFGGNQHAQQLVFADRRERLGGKARVAIDLVGVTLGDRGDRLGAGEKIAGVGRFSRPGAKIALRKLTDIGGHGEDSGKSCTRKEKLRRRQPARIQRHNGGRR